MQQVEDKDKNKAIAPSGGVLIPGLAAEMLGPETWMVWGELQVVSMLYVWGLLSSYGPHTGVTPSVTGPG